MRRLLRLFSKKPVVQGKLRPAQENAVTSMVKINGVWQVVAEQVKKAA